jgi:hypothetical protein
MSENLHFRVARSVIPTLCIEEYGVYIKEPLNELKSHGVIKCSLGLSPDTYSGYHGLGIFQSREHIDYFLDVRNKSSLYRFEQYLPMLSRSVFSSILDRDKVEGVDFAAFDSQTSLYFAYISFHNRQILLRSFIGSMLLLTHKMQKKNVILCAPGIYVDPKSFANNEMTQFLLSKGFSHIHSRELVRDKQEVKNETIALSYPEGCELGNRQLILIAGSLSHPDFINCLKASEDEVMGTGDQSLSEELVLGKKIYYQTLFHKEAFAQSLNDMIRVITKINTNFMPHGIFDRQVPLLDKINDMNRHFQSLQTPRWDDFIREIHRSQNCEENIIKTLKIPLNEYLGFLIGLATELYKFELRF